MQAQAALLQRAVQMRSQFHSTSGAAPLRVDGFRRVRRSTFTEGAITERAKYHWHSRARIAEMAKDGARHATPDAPERIDPRKRCTQHDHRTCCRGSRGSASLPCPRCQTASKYATPDRAERVPTIGIGLIPYVDTHLQRRTRRSVSTLEGAAPDRIIGRATADRAGARYHWDR